MELVHGRRSGTVQAGQARHAQTVQAVLAEITPFSPLNTYPKTLPSFRKTFIREHQHFLTQIYSHPETYSQVEATSLQSRQTQTITASANTPNHSDNTEEIMRLIHGSRRRCSDLRRHRHQRGL